jgi:hypothetical protein
MRTSGRSSVGWSSSSSVIVASWPGDRSREKVRARPPVV